METLGKLLNPRLFRPLTLIPWLDPSLEQWRWRRFARKGEFRVVRARYSHLVPGFKARYSLGCGTLSLSVSLSLHTNIYIFIFIYLFIHIYMCVCGGRGKPSKWLRVHVPIPFLGLASFKAYKGHTSPSKWFPYCTGTAMPTRKLYHTYTHMETKALQHN